MIIFENEKVQVLYDEVVPCIIWKPIDFMKEDEWRTPFVKGVDFLEKKIKESPTLTWLNDSRKLKTVPMDDLKWLNENVNNRCFKYGLKKVAFVLPENIFGRMAVKFYVDFTNKRTDNQFQIRAFKEYTEAVNWLKTSVEKGEKEVSLA